MSRSAGRGQGRAVADVRHDNAAGTAEDGDTAAFLDVVRELTRELHPDAGRRREVALDSQLDRDLGLDSLGRAELILRLDSAFGVRLPDHVLNEAETPRDLLRALGMGERVRVAETETAAVDAAVLPRIVEPAAAPTQLFVFRAVLVGAGSRSLEEFGVGSGRRRAAFRRGRGASTGPLSSVSARSQCSRWRPSDRPSCSQNR